MMVFICTDFILAVPLIGFAFSKLKWLLSDSRSSWWGQLCWTGGSFYERKACDISS